MCGCFGSGDFLQQLEVIAEGRESSLSNPQFFLFFKMKQEGRPPTVLLLKRIKRTVQYLQVTANTAMPSERLT
jgi:hypothetical protein